MKVRIKNYDSKRNEYKKFKNVYRDLTLDELINLLKKIPAYDSDKNDDIIYIATKEFVFEKRLNEGYIVSPNDSMRAYLIFLSDS